MTLEQRALLKVVKLLAVTAVAGSVTALSLNTLGLAWTGIVFMILVLAYLLHTVYSIELAALRAEHKDTK